MFWLKKAPLILLAALWLPATSHCTLEQSLDLAFLACHATAAGDSHQSSDCAADACAGLEDGFFRPEGGTVTVVAPTLSLTTFILSPIEAESSAAAASAIFAGFRSTIGRNWQFDCRAASPPRAPTPLV